MSDIFISYSKSDHALALKLSTFLESEGWTVWWDKSLGAADLYRDEIMKQLVAARAVITIWTPNSIKSDWVRAEAGRAKADGKLIAVKTPELTYAEIPLPFGEMHTENIASTDLVRAAIVAQLAKPAVSQSPFWQVTSTFKYQILTWIGIVGSAITLFANLEGILDMSDLAKEVVDHWHEWNQIIWGWAFSLIRVKVPKAFVPTISFAVFTGALVIGVNLAARSEPKSLNSQYFAHLARKIGILIGGLLLYFVTIISLLLFMLAEEFDLITLGSVAWLWTVIFSPIYLMWFVRARLWVWINSLLFFVMFVCLLRLPIMEVSREEWPVAAFSAEVAVLEICWMAAILFSPLQQLAKRLAFVVLGVVTLAVLSVISELDLHQYLKPTRTSEISSPAHHLLSHAAA